MSINENILAIFAFQCSARSFAISIIALTCNARSFAVAFLVVFFSCSFSLVIQKWTGKSFLSKFHYSLTRKCVVKVGLISLDTLTNVFVSVLFVAKFR